MLQSRRHMTLFRTLQQTGMFLGALVLILYLLFPFLWLVISSLKQPVELFATPITILPDRVVWSNFAKVLSDPSVTGPVKNSLIVAGFTTAVSVVLGTLGAYAFARFQFRGRKAMFLLVLATQMLPAMAVLIPLFILLERTGLLYKYQGLIAVNVAHALPYVLWMLRAFFVSVPIELEEAARVDGCSRLGTIGRILMPLAASGLVATAAFVFIGAWNEYLFASTLSNMESKTFPVRLAEYMGEERITWEGMFPAGVIGSIPPLILVMFFQRWLVKGLTEGGVKM